MSWDNPKIAEEYKISTENDREIQQTKKYYHDPIFVDLIATDIPNGIVRMADIGCGPGVLTRKVCHSHSKKIIECTGIDLEAMADIFWEKPATGLPLSFRKGVSTALPLANSCKNLVMSSLMYHWIADVEKTTQEMARVLEEKGVAIVSYIHPSIFHAGTWSCMDKRYVYTQYVDVTIPDDFEVYINKTVGPVRYYRHPIEYVREAFANSFRAVSILEPCYRPTNNDDPQLLKYHHYPLYVFIVAKK